MTTLAARSCTGRIQICLSAAMRGPVASRHSDAIAVPIVGALPTIITSTITYLNQKPSWSMSVRPANRTSSGCWREDHEHREVALLSTSRGRSVATTERISSIRRQARIAHSLKSLIDCASARAVSSSSICKLRAASSACNRSSSDWSEPTAHSILFARIVVPKCGTYARGGDS